MQALEVLDNCQFGRRIAIDPGFAHEVRAAVAGDDGFAVTWTEFDPMLSANTALKARTFGPHYCDRTDVVASRRPKP